METDIKYWEQEYNELKEAYDKLEEDYNSQAKEIRRLHEVIREIKMENQSNGAK